MNFKIGLCGLPNSGKSSFIKLTSEADVLIANYPFTTLKAGEYSFFIFSEELKKLHQITQTPEVIPDYLILVDVPGLIRGAHRGEGLGNEFLSYLRKGNVVLEIVRNFENKEVPHPEGKVDPLRDILIIEEEIIQAEKEILERNLKVLKKTNQKEKIEAMEKILIQLEPFKRMPEFDEILKEYNLLITKPWYLLVNGEECDLPSEVLKTFQSVYFLDVKWEIEAKEIKDLPKKFNEFSNKFRLDLNLIQFFTFTKEITQEWFIKRGSSYLEAAELIHSDFAQKFKEAQTLSLEEFLELKDWELAKKLGKIKIKGKKDKVEENEIIWFKI
ncbi:Ribosome-binding ATPase YchF [bacterium HR35]|nr:Ribosome-binding ATPase YchF [bacterium HR35]